MGVFFCTSDLIMHLLDRFMKVHSRSMIINKNKCITLGALQVYVQGLKNGVNILSHLCSHSTFFGYGLYLK